MKATELREATDHQLLDWSLADRNEEGARRAVSELLGRYQERVYIWCFRYVRDHERALDLAQEVLLGAYRKLDTFGGNARFSSWLFAVTRNRCISELRRPGLLYDEEAGLDNLPAGCGQPDELFEREEEQEALWQTIRRVLDPVEQEALWLRCVERLPVDEITKLLQLQGSTGARGLLQRARRRLKSAVRQQEDHEGSHTDGL